MNTLNIVDKNNQNGFEIKVPIIKKGQNVTNCDIFIYESDFILVCDVDIYSFQCPQKFNVKDMKDVSISFNSEKWEYTCVLPCCPDETKTEVAQNDDSKTAKTVQLKKDCLIKFKCITDSCVLSVDGKICKIQADFPYGFSGRYKGKPKYNEGDLSHICRIDDPSCFSPIKRIIQREIDEIEDFSPDQYKLDFVELQIPDGHDNPLEYTIPFDDVNLTEEEECILQKIRTKHTHIDVETDKINIDCGLVSILLGICYDVRLTSNEPTCESAWTRTILSSALSYFERCDDLAFVLNSFLRRSLIYPLYRNHDLSSLCVQDAVDSMKKGKSWILKQLIVTYKCFHEANYDRKALNKYFIRHYIWYVDTIINDDHLQILSSNLHDEFVLTSKLKLRLRLVDIEIDLLIELVGEDMKSDSESNSEGSADNSIEEDLVNKLAQTKL